MKKLIFLLLFAFFVSADTLNVKNISAVEMDVELVFEVENNADSTLSYAHFNTSTFYNASRNQQVLSVGSNAQILDTSTEYDGNQRIVLNFSLAPHEKKNITLYGKILVDYNQNISGDAPYPFSSPSNMSVYLSESDYVKITPDIQSMADLLRGNSTNTYEIATNVVNWIYHNLTYDKKYVDSTMDSAFVMRERRGVCDEYSHLAIAILRHLGIPSRIIVGYVHSGEFWGPHAWIEFWLPNQGWLEADPTFSEISWLDGTHLRISHGVDQKRVTDSFSTTASFDLKYLDLMRYQNYVFKKSDPYSPPVEAELIVPVSPVEQNQYVNVTARIKNPTQNQLFLPVRLKQSQELVLLNHSMVILYVPPSGNVSNDWTLIFPNMSMQLIYRYPVVLEIGNISDRKQIVGKKVLSEEDYPRFVLVEKYSIVPVGNAAKVSVVLTGNRTDGVYGSIRLTLESWSTELNYSLANGESMTYDLPIPESFLQKSTKGSLNITYGDYYVNLPLPINVIGGELEKPVETKPVNAAELFIQTFLPIAIILMIIISGVIIFLAKQKRIY